MTADGRSGMQVRIGAAALGICLLAALIPAARPAEARVTIESVTYDGWQGAYRLSNGDVEVVVVPAVARILRYGYVGGPNLLWTNPAAAGKPARPGEWPNFGGDKAWPWPQDDWTDRIGHAWPPPPEADQVPQAAIVIGSDTVHLESPALAGYGLKIYRDIQLASRGARVTIRTRLVKVAEPAPGERPVAAWTVTQVPAAPGRAYARLVSGSTLKDGWKSLGFEPFAAVTVHDGILTAIRHPERSSKIGVDADTLAIAEGDTLFTIHAASPDHGDYAPGERAQIYVGGEPDARDAARGITPYFELEPTSPKVSLRIPGQMATLITVWDLRKLKPGEDPAAALARR